MAGIEYKSPEQIRLMRRSGLVVAALHEAIRKHAAPGVSTGDLDAVAREVLHEHDARSNFLGYHGFPGQVCLSVNEEVVHGIPGARVLQDGDVLSADCGAVIDGWHADAAFTMIVGTSADPADQHLIEITTEAMWAGVAALATGRRLNAVGEAVQQRVEQARDAGGPALGIVTEYIGHGIGTALHQDPDVPNTRSRRRGPAIRPGLCVAVEPMLTRGSAQTHVLADEWTVVTDDGSRAAHAEHTVAVHDGGIWVLTAADGGVAGLAPLGVEVAPLG